MSSSSSNRLRDHTGEDQHVSVQRPKGGRQSQAQRIGRYACYHTHTSFKIIHAKVAVHLFYAKVRLKKMELWPIKQNQPEKFGSKDSNSVSRLRNGC